MITIQQTPDGIIVFDNDNKIIAETNTKRVALIYGDKCYSATIEAVLNELETAQAKRALIQP